MRANQFRDPGPSGAPRGAPYILSFSRKTDGPRYYARWFANTWKRGWAEARNSFGGSIRADLRPGSVAGFLGWTRDARPFASSIETLRRDAVPMVWQFTVTPYGPDLELRRPSDPVGALLWLRERLPGPGALQWRYDPIVLSDRYSEAWHLDNFGQLAERFRGAVVVCNTSIVEPFSKTVRRLDDPSVQYRSGSQNFVKTIARKPDLGAYSPESSFLGQLDRIGREFGIEVRACTNPEMPLPASQCCSLEMFAAYGPEVVARLGGIRSSPTRPGCCCLRSTDIGMDNTCVAGCRYCYAVRSDALAVRYRGHHNPDGPRMR